MKALTTHPNPDNGAALASWQAALHVMSKPQCE